MQACNQKFFRAGGFVVLGQFHKHFIKNTRKKVPQGDILELFPLDTIKTLFWMKILTQRWTPIRVFLFKIRVLFFRYSKESRGGLPPFAHLWVWLNKYQYLWISLKPWISCSGHARVLNIPNHLTFSTCFWRFLGF